MVNELERAENPPESQSDGENPSGEEEPVDREEIAGLGSLLARKDEELNRAGARLVELEQTVTEREREIAGLKQTRDELDERLATLSNTLSGAVASYRTMVVQANPEVIEELIIGDTVESINESLDRAKDLISKVRRGLEDGISLARVPAGAPERTLPDLSVLSPREKIQYATGKTK